MDAGLDLSNPLLHALVKTSGKLEHIPLGRWWPDAKSPEFAAQQERMLECLTDVPPAAAARGPGALPLQRFLDLVRRG